VYGFGFYLEDWDPSWEAVNVEGYGEVDGGEQVWALLEVVEIEVYLW
jgi:hypothetical protein